MKFVLCNEYGDAVEEFDPPMTLWSAQVILRGEQVWIKRTPSMLEPAEEIPIRFFDKVTRQRIAKLNADNKTQVQD